MAEIATGKRRGHALASSGLAGVNRCVGGTVISTPVSPQLIRDSLDTEPVERGLRLQRLPAWAREGE